MINLAKTSNYPREDLDTFEENITLGIYSFNRERIKTLLVTNSETREKELYIQIFGNTSKDDLENTKLWKLISYYKQGLPNHTKRNYPDKNNSIRQRELEMSAFKKPEKIGYELLDKFEKEEEKHPELTNKKNQKKINNLCKQTTGSQISKNIYKQKKILEINRTK